MNIKLKETLDKTINTINFVTNADVRAKDRIRKNVDARYIYFKIVRDNTDLTTEQIGSFVSRDHASVLHGLKKFNAYWDTDKSFVNTYNNILKILSDDNFDFAQSDCDLVLKYVDLKSDYEELRERNKMLKYNIDAEIDNRLISMFECVDFLLLKRLQSDFKTPKSLKKIVDHVLEKKRNFI